MKIVGKWIDLEKNHPTRQILYLFSYIEMLVFILSVKVGVGSGGGGQQGSRRLDPGSTALVIAL